jgi:hypothetical protein
MTVPILTSKFAAQAALRAYDAGMLGFQDLTRTNSGCHYHYLDGGVCAIGAALKEMSISAIYVNSEGLSSLKKEEIISFSDQEAESLSTLQFHHDGIIRAKQRNDDQEVQFRISDFINFAKKLSKQP